MTETGQPERHVTAHPAEPTPDGPLQPDDQPLPIAELVTARLARARLDEPVKALLRETLDEADAPATTTIGRVYLDSVALAGYRGISARTRLRLTPGKGRRYSPAEAGRHARKELVKPLSHEFPGADRGAPGNSSAMSCWLIS